MASGKNRRRSRGFVAPFVTAEDFGLASVILADLVWVLVLCSTVFSALLFFRSFQDASSVVQRRKEAPKSKESERQERIDKLIGKKRPPNE